MVRVAILALAAMLACAPEAQAGGRQFFRGPVEASIVRVLDGDTFLAVAYLWPGHELRVNVRIRGIDAPEMKSRCAAERAAAILAREALEALAADGRVLLSNIGGAKYYGRVLADVHDATGNAIGPALLDMNLVRAYGGGRRDGWCG